MRLKELLQQTTRGKFVKSKKAAGFRANSGGCLRGITKRLSSAVFSSGELPLQKDGPSGYGGGKLWGGSGLKRGSAVDRQVARFANVGENARRNARMLSLTKHTFHALKYHKLIPVMGQRVVVDETRRLGTAVDLICTDDRDRATLVLVELKTGYPGNRTMPVSGRLMMRTPLSKAHDCALHRHLAQLAISHHMFVSETATMHKLQQMGITKIRGVLLYVTPKESELHVLHNWWVKKSASILRAIS